ERVQPQRRAPCRHHRHRRHHPHRQRRRGVLGGAAEAGKRGPQDRPVRPVTVPLAHRRPGERLRADGLHGPQPRAPHRAVRAVLGGGVAPGHRGRGARPRRRRPRPRGRADGKRPGRRGVRRKPVHRLRAQGRPRGRPHAGPGGVQRRRLVQRGHRVRLHRHQFDERDELRLGRHRHRRRVARHPRRRGRRGDRRRRRGPAGAAVLRRVRHHPRHVHPQRRPAARLAALRRRARRLRDGRGRRGARAGRAGTRPRAGRPHLRRGAGIRHQQRRAPHDGAAAGRQPGGPGHARGAAHGRPAAGRRGRDQRPRLVDATERQHRVAGDPRGLRRARRRAEGQRHQGLPRALPGRHRRARGRHLRPFHPARLGASHAEPGTRGRRVRPWLRHGRGRHHARAHGGLQFLRFRRHQRGPGLRRGGL
ncbi:MAG: 3-oxoacyl-[acyl-carrier-protein] synthase, KASII, partial [uncultured Gemmatimonadetes bacterium]